MRKLYQATTIMGISTVISIAVGLVRAKFLAVSLGPSGVGILAQAMTFVQSAEVICSLGIGLGITKYVSEMKRAGDIDGIKKTISTSLIMQAGAFMLFFIGVVAGGRPLSQFLFSTDHYAWLLIITSGAILFSIANVSLESAFLGFGRADIFSRARIVYYTAGLALLFLLVGTMGLAGGFFYIILNAVVSFLIVLIFFRRVLKIDITLSLHNLRDGFRGFIGQFHSGKVLSYGAVVLITSSVTWLTVLYIRSILINTAGSDANGFYQVIFALVSYYVPFFTNGLWGYFFPKLSAIGDITNYNLEFNKALRFILIFVPPAIAGVFLMRRILVVCFFSNEFLPSLDIFSAYLVGSFFFVLTCVLGVALLAKNRLKAFFTMVIVQNLAYAAIFTWLVRPMGIGAIGIAYLGMNVLFDLMCYAYQVKRMGLVVTGRNKILFIAGLVMMLGIVMAPVLSPGTAGKALSWGCIAVWLVFALRKRDRILLQAFVRGGRA
ncbi:MAG: oligosaccharide flippase family protein [Candidatus Omnitrophica bacterium]|nr:oligosaccharide flippase family protein [Candidatus Omnitrophota bacterium]